MLKLDQHNSKPVKIYTTWVGVSNTANTQIVKCKKRTIRNKYFGVFWRFYKFENLDYQVVNSPKSDKN